MAQNLTDPLLVGAGVDVNVQTLTQALLHQGLLVGPQGRKHVNENIRLLVDAIYQVLSGGEVDGEVPGTITVKAGNKKKVKELQALEERRLVSINQILDEFGFVAIT
jgi:hypothetical protein